ncbi:unnamed protein product [Chironomus riparius]|uniref:Uncharacterized protein n=1 Tax=Chironomus riparius TaxID=315576 RepID=A0A9N9RP47_9DIPT|nr:unnamed protein product [Chironomus riparius]
MKLVPSTIILTLSLTTLVSSNIDIDFASVINKIQSIDVINADSGESKSIPLDVNMIISFFNRSCVIEKLGLHSIDQSQTYEIPNLKEFVKSSANNAKILVAIENAARLCTRNAKDVGLFQMVQIRSFLTKSIFPHTRSNPERATQCFKWKISQIKPDSPVLDGFDVSTMKYTVDQCKATTSLELYTKVVEEQRSKLEIRSCDLETFGHITRTAKSIIENFLFLKLSSAQIVQHEAVINVGAINIEADLLESQLNCVMTDLKDLDM